METSSGLRARKVFNNFEPHGGRVPPPKKNWNAPVPYCLSVSRFVLRPLTIWISRDCWTWLASRWLTWLRARPLMRSARLSTLRTTSPPPRRSRCARRTSGVRRSRAVTPSLFFVLKSHGLWPRHTEKICCWCCSTTNYLFLCISCWGRVSQTGSNLIRLLRSCNNSTKRLISHTLWVCSEEPLLIYVSSIFVPNPICVSCSSISVFP